MASIDLPAFLNYILQTTGAAKLSYIGHSQGTTMGFAGYENQIIANKVNIFIALAPVAWIHHSTSTLLKALADLDAQVIDQLLGVRDFAPDTNTLKILLPGICSVAPDSCENVLGLVMGWDTANLNNTRIPVILAHEPSGTSVQNIVHWAQEIREDVFQYFNYGSADKNKKHYNTTIPPMYHPSLIQIPTALFYGGNDALADPTDVETYLIPSLKNLVLQHFEPTYAHLDFVWGVNACTKIYPSILQLLEKYSSA
jgi:pimeloyl-ACP methyl ester carboxylesterase